MHASLLIYIFAIVLISLIMIHSVSNPKMTLAEVKDFRERYCRVLTAEEKENLLVLRRRMNETRSRIIMNNGGKNPILGH